MTEFEEKLEEMFERMRDDPTVMAEAMQLCHDYQESMPWWLAYLLGEYIKDIAAHRKIN